MGMTAVYFFLTKESAMRYILRPDLDANVRFFLYLEKVRRLRIGVFLLTGIFLIITFTLTHS